METKLFYARETHYVDGKAIEVVYVRFARPSNRAYWLSQGTVPESKSALKQWLSTKPTGVVREILRPNSAEVEVLELSYTFEYIDGVSYGNKRV